MFADLKESARHFQSDSVKVQVYGAPPGHALQHRIAAIVGPDYIWQRDSFKMVVDDSGWGESVVDFGDNIQDEWMVVYCLRQLTTDFPNMVSRVVDDDGQFLLIEAANVLPDWAAPEICENRTFLYQGSVHIIPPTFQINSNSQAINIIRQYAEQTISVAVNVAISNRLNNFHNIAIESCQHFSRCMLHSDACALLDEYPWLITPIVESFYHRDPLDVRAGSRMATFTPTTNNARWRSVRFTRCSFAQMESQRFVTPRVFNAWRPNDKEQLNDFERGVKVMNGFEMLVRNQVQMIAKATARGEAIVGGQIITDPETGRTIPELIESVSGNRIERELFESIRNDDASVWMNITESSLDDIASPYLMGTKTGSSVDPSKIVQSMHSFLSDMSGIEGADVVDENTPISFNMNSFTNVFASDEDEGFYQDSEECSSDEELAEYQENLEDEMGLKPVDVDLNLMKNLLESFKAQAGMPGPASTLLSSFGINVPDDSDD